MNRVVARITDGLGNQLFQYATGFAAARRAGVPLDLDVSWYSMKLAAAKPRKLRVSEIVGKQGHRWELQYSLRQRAANFVVATLSGSNRRGYQYSLPVELFRATSADCYRYLDRPCYVAGCPLNYRLFEDFLPELRQYASVQLTPRNPVPKEAGRYAFVHVRRDDLAQDPGFSKRIGVLPPKYYKDAMHVYEAAFGKTEWLVCSDNVEEAMSILPKGFSITRSPGRNEVEDLALMAAAEGGVIANSTFSLWGALLSAEGNPRFVAPSRWRQDDRPGIPVPGHWLVVSGVMA